MIEESELSLWVVKRVGEETITQRDVENMRDKAAYFRAEELWNLEADILFMRPNFLHL